LKGSERGQVSSLDFVLGAVLFLVVVPFYFFARDGLVAYSSFESEGAAFKAFRASSWLVEESGVPVDWNASTVVVPGLASEKNVVDAGKLSSFLSLDYENATRLLGLGGYNFSFALRYASGSPVLVVLANGSVVPAVFGVGSAGAVFVAPVKRVVVYGGQPAVLTLVVSRT
jgi:hypothetical protein